MHLARTAGGLGGSKYQRHQPEKTLLYQIVAQHYYSFILYSLNAKVVSHDHPTIH